MLAVDCRRIHLILLLLLLRLLLLLLSLLLRLLSSGRSHVRQPSRADPSAALDQPLVFSKQFYRPPRIDDAESKLQFNPTGKQSTISYLTHNNNKSGDDEWLREFRRTERPALNDANNNRP